MLERLLERGKTSGREDDNVESIKKRFSKSLIDDTIHSNLPAQKPLWRPACLLLIITSRVTKW